MSNWGAAPSLSVYRNYNAANSSNLAPSIGKTYMLKNITEPVYIAGLLVNNGTLIHVFDVENDGILVHTANPNGNNLYISNDIFNNLIDGDKLLLAPASAGEFVGRRDTREGYAVNRGGKRYRSKTSKSHKKTKRRRRTGRK